MIRIIKKKDIISLLKEAAKEWDVFIPQKKLGKDIWFEPLPKECEAMDQILTNITLADEDIVISPKDLFFPQLETMFAFKSNKIIEIIESSPKLLFGIKPCDLKGLLFVDDFFKRNFNDVYYSSRINKRLIVTKGCLIPPRPDACFCTSSKTGPFAKDGYDLQLVETNNFYFIEVGSTKGENFIYKYKKYFSEYSQETQEEITKTKQKASENLKLKVDFQKALEFMADDNFIPEENYKRISERCIYCGGCVYSCPTCTCFNVFENIKNSEGERLRNWDACVFEGYTREASGHNPRKEKWIRTARRYEHKLKYDFKNTGTSGCIGCGRCLARCPVSIGISKFIQEITEEKKIM